MTHSLGKSSHMQPDDEVEVELDDTIQSSEGACATETHATTATIARLMAQAEGLRSTLAANDSHKAELLEEVAALQDALRCAKADKDAERTSFESTYQLAFLERAAVTFFEAAVTRTAIQQLGKGKSKLDENTVEERERDLWFSILTALLKPEYSLKNVLGGKSERKSERIKARERGEHYRGIYLADYLVDLALLSFPLDPPIRANLLMYTILVWRAFSLFENTTTPKTSSIGKTAGVDIRRMYAPEKELACSYFIREEVLAGEGVTVSRLLSNLSGKFFEHTGETHERMAQALQDAEQGKGGALYGMPAGNILAYIVQQSPALHSVFNAPPVVEMVDWSRTHHMWDKAEHGGHITEYFSFRANLGDIPHTSKTYQLCVETAIRKAVYLAECVNVIRRRQYRIDNLYNGVGAFGSFGTGLKLPVTEEERRGLLQRLSNGLVELTIIQHAQSLGSSEPASEMDIDLEYRF